MSEALKTVTTLLIWANWGFLAVGGIYCCYDFISNFNDFTHLILVFYMTLFGIMGLCLEFGVDQVVRQVPFLTSLRGKAIFCFFVGTIGFSFGWSTKPNLNVVAFIMGLFSFATGVVCLVYSFCKKEGTNAPAVGSKDLFNQPGPNAI